VEVTVNDVKTDLLMKVGDAGEAFFVIETEVSLIKKIVFFWKMI
jgi:phosphatidate phosphatase PAH1